MGCVEHTLADSQKWLDFLPLAFLQRHSSPNWMMFLPLPCSYLADPLVTYPWRMFEIGTPGLELRPAFKCRLRFVALHSLGQAILARETITAPAWRSRNCPTECNQLVRSAANSVVPECLPKMNTLSSVQGIVPKRRGIVTLMKTSDFTNHNLGICSCARLCVS